MPSVKRNTFATKRHGTKLDAERIDIARSFGSTDLLAYLGFNDFDLFASPERAVSNVERAEFWQREREAFETWFQQSGGDFRPTEAHCVFAFDRDAGWQLLRECQKTLSARFPKNSNGENHG